MSSDGRYEPNRAFARAILTGPVAQALVTARGKRVQARANGMYGASGYGFRLVGGTNRCHGVVYTGDAHSIRSNHAHNTLLKAKG